MSGYYQYCSCCGRGFTDKPGARAYLEHLARQVYYAIPLAPEATWALSAQAREYLGVYQTFQEWVAAYYPNWKSTGPDVIPCAYGWFTFAGMPKAPEYEAWRRENNLTTERKDARDGA